MKILRIRRGYTTNSSSYTEWLPPQNTATGQEAVTTPAAPSSQNLTAVSAPTAQAPAAQGTSVQAPSQLAANSLILAGLAATLAAVFIAERFLFRRIRHKEQTGADADE